MRRVLLLLFTSVLWGTVAVMVNVQSVADRCVVVNLRPIHIQPDVVGCVRLEEKLFATGSLETYDHLAVGCTGGDIGNREGKIAR